MDLLDEYIIELLGQNAYQNIPEIARKLKVTGVTVDLTPVTFSQNVTSPHWMLLPD